MLLLILQMALTMAKQALPGLRNEKLAMPHALAQQVELGAVITVLVSKDKTPINIVSDSACIFGMTKSIETAKIKHVNSEKLFLLFLQLQKAVRSHFFPFFNYTYSSSLPPPRASPPLAILRLIF